MSSGQGTPEFTRRQRFLALCGWDVLTIRPDAAARSGNSPTDAASRNSGGGGRGGGDGALDANGIALGCEMCGARAGLWDFVPRMVPAARPGARLVTTGVANAPYQPHDATHILLRHIDARHNRRCQRHVLPKTRIRQGRIPVITAEGGVNQWRVPLRSLTSHPLYCPC